MTKTGWWSVKFELTLDGHLLKGFKTQAAAENWCREQKDFTAKGA